MKRTLAALLIVAALFTPAPAAADPITAALVSIGIPSLLASTVVSLGATCRSSFVVLADHPRRPKP